MNWITLRTPAERARGLQFMKSIPANTVWVFLEVPPGCQFHSRNVPEPFELYFMGPDDQVLQASVVHPPKETRIAPPRTSYALEARPGTLGKSPARGS